MTFAHQSGCYTGDDWRGVSLDEFLQCPTNPANNRQTRMLADWLRLRCGVTDNGTFVQDDAAMLRSAKTVLKDLAYFGLTEYQRPSQLAFERTFNLKFTDRFGQFNSSRLDDTEVTSGQWRRIHRANTLDLDLYHFAKKLFFDRFNKLNDIFPHDFTDSNGVS